jgi:hypothetical protein
MQECAILYIWPLACGEPHIVLVDHAHARLPTAELQCLLIDAASIFVTPGFVTTRNNTRWVNGRDQLIPRKYNAPPTTLAVLKKPPIS